MYSVYYMGDMMMQFIIVIGGGKTMSNPAVAQTILQQLGGNKFVVMTGAKDFVYDDNSLRFRIPRNKSKANIVTVSLRGDDTYNMIFRRYIMPKLNRKTWEWSKERRNHTQV